MKLAWIGTGVMGKSMLRHLKQSPYELHAYNRTYEKASELTQEGIVVHHDLSTCVENADIIITMVGYPQDVEAVYETIFPLVKPDRILIDMTTSSPKLAQALAKKAEAFGAHMLDAPVSGGDSGAKAGTLSIMVGGEEKIFEQVKPLLSLMGSQLHYMGAAGCGQHTKACNQIAVAGAVAAMSEAIVYAQAHDLDVSSMLRAIGGGAAGSWQLTHTAPRVLRQDFAPGFYINHFIKDMHIIQEEMRQEGSLCMLNTVCEMYEELAKRGEEENGTQALLHYYQKQQH